MLKPEVHLKIYKYKLLVYYVYREPKLLGYKHVKSK